MGFKVHSLHFSYCSIYVYVLLLSAIMDTIINDVSCRYFLWSLSNVQTYGCILIDGFFLKSFINFQLSSPT